MITKTCQTDYIFDEIHYLCPSKKRRKENGTTRNRTIPLLRV
jgi:hypothetical protein